MNSIPAFLELEMFDMLVTNSVKNLCCVFYLKKITVADNSKRAATTQNISIRRNVLQPQGQFKDTWKSKAARFS